MIGYLYFIPYNSCYIHGEHVAVGGRAGCKYVFFIAMSSYLMMILNLFELAHAR